VTPPVGPAASDNDRIVLAAYLCRPCDILGTDPEVSPGVVHCWNCGAPAYITARIAVPVPGPTARPGSFLPIAALDSRRLPPASQAD
jgi:hypothetical protein